MKIGILTFQFADNYGAVLQCFALAEATKKYVNEVMVLDYLPKQMISTKMRIKKKFIPKAFEKKFEKFRQTYFKRVNIKEIFDVILVGSDQVWNSDITAYDSFWIAPSVKYKKIYSYAASFGKSELTEKEKQYLLKHKKSFENYAMVTVREKAGIEFLKNIGVTAEIVCDPTLLFYNSPEIYNKLAEQAEVQPKEKYLLVYSLEYSKDLEQLIAKLKDETKLTVYGIHPMNARVQSCDKFVENASVYDFLSLIKKAEYVLTNSFHGLAFSYIFRKKVYCVHHSSLSSRQAELIEKSGFVYENHAENVYYIDSAQKTKEMDLLVDKSKEKLRTMVTL